MWQLSFFIVRQPDQFRRKHPYDRVIAYLVNDLHPIDLKLRPKTANPPDSSNSAAAQFEPWPNSLHGSDLLLIGLGSYAHQIFFP